MSDGQPTLTASRSDQRIPKLRTRGRANRQKLLAVAQQLIEEHGGRPIRFSEVFEAAGVSRGSAYRIYNGLEDLLQDLSSNWISNFVVYVKNAKPSTQPESWTELSDILVLAAAAYWSETAQTLRVLPRVRSNSPDSYRAAVKELTTTFAGIFDEYFVVPEIQGWLPALGMFIQLGDTMFTEAVRREGYISEQRQVEAQKICKTYLSLYLPAFLQPRGSNT